MTDPATTQRLESALVVLVLVVSGAPFQLRPPPVSLYDRRPRSVRRLTGATAMSDIAYTADIKIERIKGPGRARSGSGPTRYPTSIPAFGHSGTEPALSDPNQRGLPLSVAAVRAWIVSGIQY